MARRFVLCMSLAAIALAGPEMARARSGHKPTPPSASAVQPAGSQPDDARDTPPAAAFGGLALLSEAELRARLGQPDIARSEGAGAMWTYRLPDCALFVFFRSTAGQPLKVSGAAAGPRRRGQAPVPVETCIAEASQPHAPSS